ncbi:AbrB/MazE/SpoVT family DNA-binding domain-containing protein, partial [Bacillus cereus]
MELRRTLKIGEKEPLEIFVENEKIILKKYESHHACTITGD